MLPESLVLSKYEEFINRSQDTENTGKIDYEVNFSSNKIYFHNFLRGKNGKSWEISRDPKKSLASDRYYAIIFLQRVGSNDIGGFAGAADCFDHLRHQTPQKDRVEEN